MLMPFEDLFERRGIRPSQINGILHLGANTGQEAQTYHALGIRNVIWVEAHPALFNELKEHLTRFNGQRAYRACISEEDNRIAIFHVANNGGQSSSILELGTHRLKHPTVHYTNQIQMATQTVDTLLRRHGEPIFGKWLLNADLQGAELLALKGMRENLPHFHWLYLEVNKEPLYVGCPLLPELDGYLNERGFKRTEIQMAGTAGWGDALYERCSPQ